MRKVTLREVADAAGVHPATASRALNVETRGLVNSVTARRITRVADALGYRPNPVARTLKTAKSGMIGVVLPDLTNPMFPPIVRGIDEALEPARFSTMIVNTDNDEVRERSLIESLRGRQVEGFIIATALLDHALLRQLADDGVLMVLVNRQSTGVDTPSILPDDARGIALAVRHLAELGHRDIVHLAGPQNTSTGVVRARAFRAEVEELGLNDDPAMITGCERWSEEAGAEALRRLLDQGVAPTAVVAGNDLIALGCYDVFAERGIVCPEEISVVGFNDMPFLDKMRPPLTTVAVPNRLIGVEAGRMLLEAIAAPGRPARSVLLPLSLVERGSTARVVTSRTVQGAGRA